MKNRLLFPIVFLAGALTMVLEMAGSRLLAPFVGTSAVVWTGLIGVILAAMAAGAHYGGKRADKDALGALSLSLSAGGLATVVSATFFAHAAALVSSIVPSIHVAAVLDSALLLAPPAFFFGMATPCAMRLSIADRETAGSAAGRVCALSTTGSILGTFLGGFVLISFFRSSRILLGTSALALCLAFLVPAMRFRTAFLAVCAALAACMASDPFANFIAFEDSPYGVLAVFDSHDKDGRPIRLISTDPSEGKAQSGIRPDAPNEILFEYVRGFAEIAEAKKIKNALVLGGGGYTLPRHLLSLPRVQRVDVVEIDPMMTKLSKMYFFLKDDPRLRVFHEDGRAFLNRNEERYDAIFVDVFSSNYSIPFHLATLEAFALARRALAEGGVLCVNVIGRKGSELIGSIFGAAKMKYAKAFFVSNLPDGEKQNVVIAASDVPFPVPERLATFEREVAARAPMTDDFAPVEKLTLF